VKLKLSVLTILVAILISTALASPEVMVHFNVNTNAAEPYDVEEAIKLITIESPVDTATKEWLKENSAKRARAAREELIDTYLAELVAKYEQAAITIEDEQSYPIVIEGKVAYLTFDDGPSPVITPKVLSILDKYGIKATFFVVGSMADKFPEVLQQVRDGGHSIGNHTYSHVYDYIYRNSANFLADLTKAESTFKKILGDDFESDIIRFPGGTHAKYKWVSVKAAEAAGYRWFDWNTVNGDSEIPNPTPEYLMSRFLTTYGNRDVIIILMHDTDSKQTTVDTLPMMIEHLINEGYSFGTLDNYNH
jgi:peptidoglycan/xylan/chitin deacetylase (PgdA/CDA1 family)